MRHNVRVWPKKEAIEVEVEEAARGDWTVLLKTEKEATLRAK
jgi:hypothetical protein